ncbi:MAG: helix-turn-helix domain-containing protein [Solirubrobacterales bacterium]
MPGQDTQAVRDKFSENLRRVRTKRGLSQEDLARLTEMHRTEISTLERGRREPRLGTLIRLSAVLEVPLSELFEGIEWAAFKPPTRSPGRYKVSAPGRLD